MIPIETPLGSVFFLILIGCLYFSFVLILFWIAVRIVYWPICLFVSATKGLLTGIK